jgi:hypothetical protein
MLENQKPSTPLLIEDLGLIKLNESHKKHYRYGIFLCECGNKFTARISHVKTRALLSCGCYHKRRVYETKTKHGLCSHKIYATWCRMISRTTDANGNDFDNYMGRGIKVCDEWKNSFKFFYDWSIQNGYKDGLSIDRIDNNGNYAPYNCRWTTKEVQSRNTRVLKSTNTSGYRGVSYRKDRNTWIAQIVVNCKRKVIGTFHEKIDAAKAYDKYVIDNNLEHTINGVEL